MGNLKLGIDERYNIDKDFIEKYNIKAGDISPFTRLRIIDIEKIDDDIDIKKPATDNEIDIKKVTSDTTDMEDIDIRKISSSVTNIEEIDIKKPSYGDEIDEIDIKKIKRKS